MIDRYTFEEQYSAEIVKLDDGGWLGGNYPNVKDIRDWVCWG